MGHLFPYFDGMLLPDKSAIGHIFFSLFANGLGDDSATIADVSKRLREGFKQLSYTRAGMILSHIFKGIELALQSRAILRPLIERGTYLGFTLSGDVAIVDKGRVHAALSSTALQDEVMSISQHENAIEEIMNLLRQVVDDDDNRVINFSPDDFLSSRRLHILLSEIDWEREEIADARIREKVLDQVERLRFGENYAEINEENIIRLVTFLARGTFPKKSSGMPFYLSRGTALSRNNIIRNLAIFGPLAPSIMIGNLKKSFSRPGAQEPLLKKDDSGRTPLLPYIPIYMRPIISAAGEWKRVANTGSMMFKGPRKGQSGFTDRAEAKIIIADYEAKEQFLDQVKLFAYPDTGDDEPPAKRTASGEGTDREAKRMRVEKQRGDLQTLAKRIF